MGEMSMELCDKAKVELKDLMDRTIYLNEKELYENIFTILKAELDFLYDVTLDINDQNGGASFDMEKKILSIDPEENYYYAKKYALSYREVLAKEDIEDFTKYAIPLIVLHEVTHGEQSACAYDDYSKYPEINYLYRRIFELDEWWNIPMRINYWRRGDSFFFERNANLNAFSEVLPIVPEKYHDIFKFEYVYNYLKNYDTLHGKIMTPVRKTFKMIWGNYDIIDTDIPENLRIMQGLDIDGQEYNYYIYEIDKLGIEASTYDEIQRRLRKKE